METKAFENLHVRVDFHFQSDVGLHLFSFGKGDSLYTRGLRIAAYIESS
jgi:hypothetical protein